MAIPFGQNPKAAIHNFFKVAETVAVSAMLVGVKSLLIHHGGDDPTSIAAVSGFLKELGLDMLTALHFRKTANDLNNDEATRRAERSQLFTKDLGFAVGESIKTIASRELGATAKRRPWTGIIASIESSWMHVAQTLGDSALGPLADSKLIDIPGHTPQQPPFPPMNNLRFWRALLIHILQDATKETSVRVNKGDFERVVKACDVYFREEFYKTLTRDFANGGGGFAGVTLQSIGEIVLGIRSIKAKDEQMRRQLEHAIALLRDAAKRVIDEKSAAGTPNYEAFKPWLNQVLVQLDSIHESQLQIHARLHGPTLQVDIARQTEKQLLGSAKLRGMVALFLVLLVIVLVASIQNSPQTAIASRTQGRGSTLDPILQALRGRDGTSLSHSGAAVITRQLQRKLRKIQTEGTPLNQAMAILILAEESQSPALLADVDARIASIEKGFQGQRWNDLASTTDYQLLKGYRFLLAGDPDAALDYLVAAHAGDPHNPKLTFVLCSALREANDTDSGSHARAIQAITETLAAPSLDRDTKAALRGRLAVAMYLSGETIAARDVFMSLGLPREIETSFLPGDAMWLLAHMGQIELGIGNAWAAVEILEAARRVASKIIPQSHPEYAAIRVAQAHAFIAVGKIDRATDAIKDLQPLLDEGVTSNNAITPFAFSAAADVAAYEASQPGASANAWDDATKRQLTAYQMFYDRYGPSDIRTLESAAQLAVILWNQDNKREARGAMAPLIEAVKNGVRHPRMVPLCMACSAMITLPIASFVDDDSHSILEPDVRDAIALAEAGVQIALQIEEATRASKYKSVAGQRDASILVSDALARLTECQLLAGLANDAVMTAMSLNECRSQLYGKADEKYWLGIALLGRAYLLFGDTNLAEGCLLRAYGGFGQRTEPHLRARIWAVCRSLCILYARVNETQAAATWCTRASDVLSNN